MKNIIEIKEKCTGCAACEQVCRVNAIQMEVSSEGFTYPKIDINQCTNCGQCLRRCPVNIEHDGGDVSLKVYAGQHRSSDIIKESSSGGIFSSLAESILDQNGAVVGATLDETLKVRHIIIESKADLPRLRGSKYVQSELSREIYKSIKQRIANGQKVFFCGTPCQVAGMKSHIGKPHENFLSADIICHGVPSPRYWERYLAYRSKSVPVSGVNFRDKSLGWKKSGPLLRLDFSSGKSRIYEPFHDPFLQAFMTDDCLRESCYCCRFANYSRCGDVSIGDYWGVSNHHPEYSNEDRGVSLILINTEHGMNAFNTIKETIIFRESKIEYAVPKNPMLTKPAFRPDSRNSFYSDLSEYSFEIFMKRRNITPPPERVIKYRQFKQRLKVRLNLLLKIFTGRHKTKAHK